LEAFVVLREEAFRCVRYGDLNSLSVRSVGSSHVRWARGVVGLNMEYYNTS